MNNRSKNYIFSHCTENSPKLSTSIRSSDTVSLSYFIILPVISDPHVSQKSKKKKSNDSWKGSILIELLIDKKINNSVPL